MLSGCSDKNIIFKQYTKFDNYEWKQDDPRTFTIHIDDNRKSKEMILSFRYATGYRFDKVFLKVTEIDPEGKRTMRDVDFRVRDEDGNFLGDKGFDIIDLDYVLDAHKEYPMHGDYTYTIEHVMPNKVQTLNYVMEIGLILQEQKEK